jgi:WD40 repeat protein
VDGTVKLWEASTGTLVRTIIGHTGTVNSVAFSPDSQTITSGGIDGSVRIWDAQTGIQLKLYDDPADRPAVYAVAYSADSAGIAIGRADGSLGVFDNPYARVISGAIDIQEFLAPNSIPWITFQIYPVGGTVPILTTRAGLDASGNCTFAMTLPPGTYDVAAKSATTLRKRLASVDLSASRPSALNFTLLNGDCDGDNQVTIADYVILSNAFERTPTMIGWDARADLDGDGRVTILDFLVLSANYERVGD